MPPEPFDGQQAGHRTVRSGSSSDYSSRQEAQGRGGSHTKKKASDVEDSQAMYSAELAAAFFTLTFFC